MGVIYMLQWRKESEKPHLSLRKTEHRADLPALHQETVRSRLSVLRDGERHRLYGENTVSGLDNLYSSFVCQIYVIQFIVTNYYPTGVETGLGTSVTASRMTDAYGASTPSGASQIRPLGICLPYGSKDPCIEGLC